MNTYAVNKVLSVKYPEIHKSIVSDITPRRRNLEDIQILYDSFNSFFEVTIPKNQMRLKFISAILHLYSPVTLHFACGSAKGVVPELKKVLGVKHQSSISHIISNARANMKRKVFRDDVYNIVKMIEGDF